MLGRISQSISKRLFKSEVNRTSSRKPASCKLGVECLEGRMLMAANLTAPILIPAADQEMTARQDALSVGMIAFDANGDSLSANVGAPGTAAYQLDQRLGLIKPVRTPVSAQPLRARWMQGAGGQTYGVLPNGELRQWRGTLARTRQREALVARLDVGYHLSPRLLWQAPAPAALPAVVSLHVIPFKTGPRTIDILQLTVNPTDSYLGTFGVEVSASDGRALAVRSFAVTVHPASNQAPVLEAIPDQSITAGGTVVVPLVATDADGDAITYTARAVYPGNWLADGAGVSLDIHGNELTIDAGDVTGSFVVEVSVSDGAVTASQTFYLKMRTFTVTVGGAPESQTPPESESDGAAVDNSDNDANSTTLPTVIAPPPYRPLPAIDWSVVTDRIASGWINGFDEMVVGDFDGDGRDDILFREIDSGENRIAFARGNENFTIVLDRIPRDWINGFDQVVVGDFNGDGADDLFFREISNGMNRLIMSAKNGKEEFYRVADPIAPGHVNGYTRMVAGDLNGDGADDLFFIVPESGDNRIAWSRGNFHFDIVTRRIADGWVNGYDEVVAGDFDGDRRDDLFFRGIDSGENRIAFARGVEDFTIVTNRLERGQINGFDQVHVGDINRDGKDDLLFREVGSGANRIALARPGNDEQFDFVNQPIEPGHINTVFETGALGDFDGDGCDEPFLRNFASGTNRILFTRSDLVQYAERDGLQVRLDADGRLFVNRSNAWELRDNGVGSFTVTPDGSTMGVFYADNILRVYGSDSRDEIRLHQENGHIKIQGGLAVLHGRVVREVPARSLKGIVVFGYAGDDLIDMLHSPEFITVPTEIYGGDGNDLILGPQGDDRLFGGSGDDHIVGHNGNDVIFGNAGNDVLVGGSGNDLLYGGDGSDEIQAGDGDDLIFEYGQLTEQGSTWAVITAGGDRNFIEGGDNDDFIVKGTSTTDIVNLENSFWDWLGNAFADFLSAFGLPAIRDANTIDYFGSGLSVSGGLKTRFAVGAEFAGQITYSVNGQLVVEALPGFTPNPEINLDAAQFQRLQRIQTDISYWAELVEQKWINEVRRLEVRDDLDHVRRVLDIQEQIRSCILKYETIAPITGELPECRAIFAEIETLMHQKLREVGQYKAELHALYKDVDGLTTWELVLRSFQESFQDIWGRVEGAWERFKDWFRAQVHEIQRQFGFHEIGVQHDLAFGPDQHEVLWDSPGAFRFYRIRCTEGALYVRSGERIEWIYPGQSIDVWSDLIVVGSRTDGPGTGTFERLPDLRELPDDGAN